MTYYDGTGDAPVYPLVHATETNLQALYRKCVHLGYSVPHCETSMLFECPCHGSKYRLHGEHFEGPAPRGLDRFPVTIEKGIVVVDTGDLQTGPRREPTRGRDSPAARGRYASRALSPGPFKHLNPRFQRVEVNKAPEAALSAGR
jgi:cytochrome b6-f complex iron-sulfur subunit